MFMADLGLMKWFLKSPACFRSHTKYENILFEVCILLNKYEKKEFLDFFKKKHLKSIWPSQITVNIGHLSMKLLVICSAFSMLINVNIPTHLILDESDMYVSNPDITTWLQSQASLSSHVYTLNACMWNNHSSGCRGCPKCCFNQSLIRIRCYGRVIDCCCTSLFSAQTLEQST